ncbi:unnamed protein product [Gordionus sp. m RMFG-2023]
MNNTNSIAIPINETHVCVTHPFIGFNQKLNLFFSVLLPVLWIIGFVGNSFGFFLAMQEKPYPKIILTRSLFAVNMLNSVTMLLYPVINVIGETRSTKFWMGASWKKYLADYHFPIAKSLVNLSFGIYIILTISNMIAIVYPYKYKRWFRTPRIILMILLCLLYLILWYLPARWWFYTQWHINLCGFNANERTYILKFSSYGTRRQKKGWMAYDILREMFTKFLPILGVIIVRIWSIRKTKKQVDWRLQGPANTHDPAKSSNKIFKFKRNKDGSNLTQNISIKRKDYDVDYKMMIIMGLEFVVFLLPVSIFLISRYVYKNVWSDYNTELAFTVCTLMEYLYISLIFYLNILINPGYRDNFILTCKDFCKKRIRWC